MSDGLEHEPEFADVYRPVARRTSKARTLTEIRSLARSHTRTAINVLVGVMRSDEATPAARVSAANAILDRGWGKVAQPLENSDDGVLELIHRIERIIVHPEKSGSGES
ncbi:hypothetical protein ACFQZO_27640 [Bradyrhizobium sp. GCM10027634]|uniref:hypothetical protein n=1 Tax=unclassified Bradyrhizobium TaxID=2631580 RepID=UPI00188C5547|nr:MULTISPECIES: hypothetical protein [unclassified Bradyrhizobium]MDN5004627.1 hypothetical protein [Bradyrhizobium sp. WYCCWR 12677]QOZ43936.1 hypothetical protein XH89_10885 [Bradyrhizobium sp. CCBAU 53340]